MEQTHSGRNVYAENSRNGAGVTFQDLHQHLIQNWKSIANLTLDKRPTPIHERQAITNGLTRPDDSTNPLLHP